MKTRVRAVLAVMGLALGVAFAVPAVAAPARGTGNCRLCGCKPWVGGSSNICGRATCGHRYYDHY